MKPNEQQEAHLALMRDASERFRNARATAYARAKKIVEDEIRSFEIEVQKLAAMGQDMGLSFNRMAKEGMGLQNGTTARAAAEAGRQFIEPVAAHVEPEPVEQESERYSYDPAARVLTVTIDGVSQAFTRDQNDLGAELLEPADGEWSTPVAKHVLSDAGKAEALTFIHDHDQ